MTWGQFKAGLQRVRWGRIVSGVLRDAVPLIALAFIFWGAAHRFGRPIGAMVAGALILVMLYLDRFRVPRS